ncbi:MAG: HEAT repeat domain-containing protein [Myxococcales bacterium]|nr:HEAT repeat domain-containing protein [Polyangiaceae bacterium]MDW8250242.1 HEAT repeat domain-containing protein [Myxococcales bacterium]
MQCLLSARSLSWLALFVVLAASRLASAGEKVEELSRQLRESDDFRVRTQAALALGVTKELGAVKPLCSALEDGHEAVRSAAAAALGKLARVEGLPCLKDHESKEPNSKVKAQITQSIKALETISKAREKGEIPENARWYVSIGKINNKTSRSNSEIEEIIRGTLTNKLRSMDGYAVAPPGEKADAAKKILQAKKLKGFEFQITAEAPVYDGDKVVIALKVMITSYPGKDIKAASSPKISQSGVHKQDTAVEDQLLKLLLEDAIEKFDKSVASM